MTASTTLATEAHLVITKNLRIDHAFHSSYFSHLLTCFLPHDFLHCAFPFRASFFSYFRKISGLSKCWKPHSSLSLLSPFLCPRCCYDSSLMNQITCWLLDPLAIVIDSSCHSDQTCLQFLPHLARLPLHLHLRLHQGSEEGRRKNRRHQMQETGVSMDPLL